MPWNSCTKLLKCNFYDHHNVRTTNEQTFHVGIRLSNWLVHVKIDYFNLLQVLVSSLGLLDNMAISFPQTEHKITISHKYLQNFTAAKTMGEKTPTNKQWGKKHPQMFPWLA